MPDGRPKILSPTLREKKRYIAYQVVSEQKVLLSDLTNAIWHSLMSFLGELTTAHAKIWIMKDSYNEEKQTGIIKCSHVSVEHVRSALALIQRIGDTRTVIKILGVSGTIKGARRKFLHPITLETFVHKPEEDEQKPL